MVRKLVCNVAYHWFEHWSDQINSIGICYFSAKYTELRRKYTYLLASIQDYVSEN